LSAESEFAWLREPGLNNAPTVQAFGYDDFTELVQRLGEMNRRKFHLAA
jgi:hypothetical protein